jgi:NAD(P)H dehydrogenase (quinone)
VAYQNLPASAFASALTSVGIPEPFARVLTDSDVHAAAGSLYEDSRTLSRLIGRPTTPMATAVAAALAQMR